MKQFLKNPLNIIISLICFVAIFYFGVLTYKELKPKTLQEKKMACLRLRSNYGAATCLQLLEDANRVVISLNTDGFHSGIERISSPVVTSKLQTLHFLLFKTFWFQSLKN